MNGLHKATGGNILLGDLVSVFVRLIGFLQPMQVYLLAGALEYKDKAYGGNWDWIDFGLTVAGTCVGQLVRTIV